MNLLEIRNAIVERLSEHLGIKVILSDQMAEIPDYPFMYYSMTTPYAPTGEYGHYSSTESDDGKTAVLRTEQPSATFSFTACSINRWSKDDNDIDIEPYILGEDEAYSITDEAIGYFNHTGYRELSALGIVVIETTNAGNRTSLMVDEAARRYGFDLRIRYTRTDTAIEETITRVATTQEEME